MERRSRRSAFLMKAKPGAKGVKAAADEYRKWSRRRCSSAKSKRKRSTNDDDGDDMLPRSIGTEREGERGHALSLKGT